MPQSRFSRSRGAIATAVVAVAVLGTTACTSAPNSAAPSTIELTTRAAAGDGPVERLTWNLPEGEPTTIDPMNAATISGAGVVTNLCDPLLAVDENYTLGSGLASFEQVTPTQIVYTLAEDATFWDGTPVTAQDVAYSLTRASGPTSTVSFVFASVASIETTGEKEVTVNFTAPDVLFNASMATFSGMVVQQAYAEQAGESFGSSSGGLMCSGPYELERWTPGDSITLTKNPNYWNPDLPLLADNVTFTFITDSTAATQALTAGEVDGSYEIPATAITPLRESTQGTVYFGSSMQQVGIAVARPDGAIADLDLRNALQVLVDRQALADAVYNGAADPAYAAISPATWPAGQTYAYQEAWDQFESERTFDLEKASALVEQSSYDGTPLVLAVPAGNETLSRVAQLVQQQASQAGITIEISSLQPLDFAQAGYDAETRSRLGLDLMLSASFNVAHEPLEPIGFTYLPDSFYNYTGFNDDRATQLIVEARETLDDDERAQKTIELQSIYEANSGLIPLVNTNTVTFLNNRLGGAVTSFAYLSMPSMAFIGSTE